MKQITPENDEATRKAIVDFILNKAGHLLDEETEHRFVEYLERHKTDINAMLHVKSMFHVAEKSYRIGFRDGKMEGSK